MHMYNGYHIWGMHLIWWFILIAVVVWLFITPWNLPGRKKQNDSPLDILQKRFASGQITKEQYQEQKTILENDKPKK